MSLIFDFGLSKASKEGSRLLVSSAWELVGGARSCESTDGRGGLVQSGVSRLPLTSRETKALI